MIEQIKNFLNENNLLNNNSRLVVGFSGGFDSSALLYILSKLKQQFNFSVCAAHLNHSWRKEADAEEEYCRSFCKQNDIDFYTEKLNPKTPKTETAAREARYEFYNRAAKKFKTQNIITAHTKSDNAETLIYRLAKGTGVRGLCAIEPITEMNGLQIFRPMMNISREEIEAFCKKNNLSPNNDKSNFDTKYKRNLIRHEILPLIKKINPQAENAINSLSELAKANEEIINEYLKTVYPKIQTETGFSTKKFLKLSNELQQRIIYNLIVKIGLDYDKKKVNEIIDFIKESSASKAGSTLSLCKNLWLFCNKDEFYTISAEQKNSTIVKIDNFDKKYNFDGHIFSITPNNTPTKNYPKETENYALSDLSCQTGLELRYRKDGDKIQPFGMKETIKLKKYFINKGIPQHKKDKIVLLCNSEEVLWAVGVGLSEKLRVNSAPTHIMRIDEV